MFKVLILLENKLLTTVQWRSITSADKRLRTGRECILKNRERGVPMELV